MRVRIQQYKAGSQSARELSERLGVKRLRMEGSRFRPRPGDSIINWGSTERRFPLPYYLNDPNCVSEACHKLQFFNLLSRWNLNRHDHYIDIPEFTDDMQVAMGWVGEGHTVIARTMLRASGGRGIHVLNRDTPMVRAPLYTKYMKKLDEYRVHVVDGDVIHVQQKRRRRDQEDVDNQVRNHDNGWVFTINDVNPPDKVLDQARLAMVASNLDFGAVDVIWNQFHETAKVLEINTAPGLEGTTLDKYTEAFTKLLNL